jgi:MFS-type transporter involved in bile tolerance (Atg22 family)
LQLITGFHTTTYTAILYASSTLKMSPSKIIIIGVLVQLAAVISSILAPKLWVILLAEIIPIYACIGLVLPFGGLRTEGEMYVAATWFGLVSYADTSTRHGLMYSYTVHSRVIVELYMLNSFHLYVHLAGLSISN